MVWVVPVVLGRVVHPGLGAAQHVAVREQTQPEVGGGDAPPADVTLRVGEELAQVYLAQSAYTGRHVGTQAGHSQDQCRRSSKFSDLTDITYHFITFTADWIILS